MVLPSCVFYQSRVFIMDWLNHEPCEILYARLICHELIIFQVQIYGNHTKCRMFSLLFHSFFYSIQTNPLHFLFNPSIFRIVRILFLHFLQQNAYFYRRLSLLQYVDNIFFISSGSSALKDSSAPVIGCRNSKPAECNVCRSINRKSG